MVVVVGMFQHVESSGDPMYVFSPFTVGNID